VGECVPLEANRPESDKRGESIKPKQRKGKSKMFNVVLHLKDTNSIPCNLPATPRVGEHLDWLDRPWQVQHEGELEADAAEISIEPED
jgi:hypothetical protein